MIEKSCTLKGNKDSTINLLASSAGNALKDYLKSVQVF